VKFEVVGSKGLLEYGDCPAEVNPVADQQAGAQPAAMRIRCAGMPKDLAICTMRAASVMPALGLPPVTSIRDANP
jgi:hypothetical protein